MAPLASRGGPVTAHSRQSNADTPTANPPTGPGASDRAARPAGDQPGEATAIALFAEPIRGTHASGSPVMILGLEVATTGEPTIFGVDTEGRPKWWTLAEITFDLRWSVRLGRWADLEEIVRPSNEPALVIGMTS